MEKVSSFFIKNYKLTIVLSIGMLIYGAMGLMKMNSESYPQVDFAMATVVTPYDGASANDVETKVTKPIEDEIRTVSGLKDVRSISQAGLSTIFVEADIDNVNVPEVMSDIQKAIDRVTDLPKDISEQPKFTEIKTEEMPVFEIAVVGDNKGRQRDQVADLLKEELEDNVMVKGVRRVGFSERRFQIELDLKKMETLHIGVSEVTRQIQLRNVNIPGGSLKESSSQNLVRIEGQIENVDDLKNMLIRSNFSGQEILLKDIAEVNDGEEEKKVIAGYNGQEATLLIVSKKANADTIALVEEANKTLKSFGDHHPEMQFFVYNNEATKVEKKLDVLSENAFTGLILVIVFLFIFLPGRIGLLASLSLPLAVMMTIGMMPSFGMNLNAITILALVIALGMLVDNSVVISENFTRLRKEGMTAMDAASLSIRQLWLPITATAFTTIAAFMPMLVTKGIMGQFIKWIPIVVSLSLIFSLIESFFFLPMRLVQGGGKVKALEKDEESGKTSGADWFHRFEGLFENFMRKMVRFRYLVVVAFFTVIAFSVYLIGFANKFILFPADQTEVYIARFESQKGSRIEPTNLSEQALARKVKEILGDKVDHIVGRSGTSKMDMTDPKAKDGNNVGMLIIYVNEETRDFVPHTEVLKDLRTIAANDFGLKDLTFEARVNGPPVGNPIEATFRSNSFGRIDQLINLIIADLEKVKGVKDLKSDDVFGDDEIQVKIDYQKADRMGLSVQSIGSTIRTAVSGQVVSTVTLDNKDVDLNVRFKEGYRKNIADLSNIEIMDSRGNLVPLKEIATFKNESGKPQIKRFDFKRAKTLTGDVDETIITANEANKELVKIYEKYASGFNDVSLTFGGVAENTKESMESLFNALILSLIGIFALLVFLFSSYLRPLIIMTTIPLGLLGFSIAFYMHQRPVSFLSLIGIIGLGGIIVNSGIVLISFIDQLKEEGELSLEEILAKASRLRLRAVFVTSLTTISGLIPTAYGIGGADAMLVPMTLAMAWGLTSGTVLTLVWVPCAYMILEDFTGLFDKILKRNHQPSDVNESKNTREAEAFRNELG